MIKVAVYNPNRMPESFRVYIDNIVSRLPDFGVRPVKFTSLSTIPDTTDVLWDPRAGGGNAPPSGLARQRVPLIVTLHGAAPFSVSLTEQSDSIRERAEIKLNNLMKRLQWARMKNRCAQIITVSQYAKNEISTNLWLPKQIITPIYHGVDTTLFKATGSTIFNGQYFFHVSRHQPKKNFHRICRAYTSLAINEKPKLIAVLPGYDGGEVPEGVEIIAESINQERIASYLRGAIGLIFPSLHETFGLPIVEAMSCGCPVLTANTTACIEIAGNAAILVDPRSVAEIRDGMETLLTNVDMRHKLREQGLTRSRLFSWQSSTEAHADIFKSAVTLNRL